jgi:hypothetical protein
MGSNRDLTDTIMADLFRSHTGEKPFHCKFNCNKKFSNSSDRAKHEQTHKDPVGHTDSCTRRLVDK